jgi:hypothetical protein
MNRITIFTSLLLIAASTAKAVPVDPTKVGVSAWTGFCTVSPTAGPCGPGNPSMSFEDFQVNAVYASATSSAPPDFLGPFSASARADLGTGKLGAKTLNGLRLHPNTSYGFAQAKLSDYVTFTSAGAPPSARNTISFSYDLHGTFGTALIGLSYIGVRITGDTQAVNARAHKDLSDSILRIASAETIGIFNIVGDTLIGQIDITGPSETVFLELDIVSIIHGDFFNTATFSFDALPSGTTYSSLSGIFLDPNGSLNPDIRPDSAFFAQGTLPLDTAIPEPASLALFGIGFAEFVAQHRRRKLKSLKL